MCCALIRPQDWLPKFRAGYHYSPVSSIVNAFAVRSMEMMSELANATGRAHTWGARLASQAARTREAMLARMYNPPALPAPEYPQGSAAAAAAAAARRGVEGLWCDGLCDGAGGAGGGGHVSFHPQHYLLWLGLTPSSGVPPALSYLGAKGMVGSTYSAHSVRVDVETNAPHCS